jgi:small-conductance mechanosensitive channel
MLRELTMLLIVAIAWIYVVLMMSIAEHSVIAGIMTFLLYCVLPLTIILYLLATPQRRRQRTAKAAAAAAAASSLPNGTEPSTIACTNSSPIAPSDALPGTRSGATSDRPQPAQK